MVSVTLFWIILDLYTFLSAVPLSLFAMMWFAGSHHDIVKLYPNPQEVLFSHADAFWKLPHGIVKAELVARLVPTQVFSHPSATHQAGFHTFQVPDMPTSFKQIWIITWNGGKTICIVMMHLLNAWVATQTHNTCCPSFLVWCTSFRMFRWGPHRLRGIWTRTHTLVHKLHELSFDLRTVSPKTIFKYFLAVSIQMKVAIHVHQDLCSCKGSMKQHLEKPWISTNSLQRHHLSWDSHHIPRSNLCDTYIAWWANLNCCIAIFQWDYLVAAVPVQEKKPTHAIAGCITNLASIGVPCSWNSKWEVIITTKNNICYNRHALLPVMKLWIV